MSTPSLLNIPYLYKAGTLYSQIPESGAGDFTVSRTTTVANRSTRINKDGFIETVLDNVPRLDYPVGGAVNGCPALLVEPAATNICLQSADFSTTWTPGQQGTGLNAAITTNAAIAPDGNLTADLIVFNRGAGNTSNDRSTLTQQPAVVSGTVYTQSVYLKAATSGDVGKQIGIRNVAQAGVLVITLTANWVRYSKTETAPSNSGFWQFINIGGSTADNTVSVHAWGAQLEVGSVPTSYIPTTTAAVTRSGEIISDTTATALIGQTEGTIYWEGAISRIDRVLFSLAQGTSTTNCIYLQTLSNGFFRADASVNGSATCAISSLAASTLGQFYKIAFAYKENDFALYINGVLQGSDNLGALPTGLSNAIFARGDSSLITDQRCRAIELHPNRIPNTAAPGVLSLATLTAL